MEEIVINKIYPSDIHSVWEAISNSAAIEKWFMPNDLQLEMGAKFRFSVPPNDNWDGFINCVITKLEPPYRLSYSWTGTHIMYDTEVHWELSEVEEGTRLQLTHQGFQSSIDADHVSWFDKHLKGWNKFLEQLGQEIIQYDKSR